MAPGARILILSSGNATTELRPMSEAHAGEEPVLERKMVGEATHNE
jgi:hypothetical protein